MLKLLCGIIFSISIQYCTAQSICVRNVVDFGSSSGDYIIQGSASLIDSSGVLYVKFSSDFYTDNGPDLHVYLAINDEAPTTPGNTLTWK